MAAMMPELKFELQQAYIESQVKLAEEIIHELCRQERISERNIRVWVDNDDTYCVGLYIATEDAGRYMALNQALDKLVLASGLDFIYAMPVIFCEG